MTNRFPVPEAVGGGGNAATIAPVASIGTLAVSVAGAGTTGGVVFGGASTFLVETAATGSADRLVVTGSGGNLSMATATDTLSVLASQQGTNTIAQYGGTRNGIFDTVLLNGMAEPGTTLSVTDPTGFTTGAGALFTSDSGNVAVFYNDTAKDIEVTVVPEPASAGLLGAVALVGLLARRRRARGVSHGGGAGNV